MYADLLDELDHLVQVHLLGLAQNGRLVQLEYVDPGAAQLEHDAVGLHTPDELGHFALALDAEMGRADQIDLAVEGRVQHEYGGRLLAQPRG